MKNADGLLHCPHCGSLKVGEFDNPDRDGRPWVLCAKCDACSPQEVWNQRDDAEELIDTMVKLLPFALDRVPKRHVTDGGGVRIAPTERKEVVKEASLWALEVCRAAHKQGKDLS